MARLTVQTLRADVHDSGADIHDSRADITAVEPTFTTGGPFLANVCSGNGRFRLDLFLDHS